METILLSNDDGVYAEGLYCLWKHLKDTANLVVVAPERDHSGASNSLTLDKPLRVSSLPHRHNFYSVDGTPTDSVHLAITGLISEPDMVISGINAGANLGDDVLYSGTVAAAMEGRSLGYPALAVSLASSRPQYFDTAARVVKQLLELLRVHPLDKNSILNVNVPDCPFSEIQGMQATRLGHRHRAEAVERQEDPRGRTIYWIGPAGAECDAGEGTDFYAVNQGYVSVTPLKIDLTHHQGLTAVNAWLSKVK